MSSKKARELIKTVFFERNPQYSIDDFHNPDVIKWEEVKSHFDYEVQNQLEDSREELLSVDDEVLYNACAGDKLRELYKVRHDESPFQKSTHAIVLVQQKSLRDLFTDRETKNYGNRDDYFAVYAGFRGSHDLELFVAKRQNSESPQKSKPRSGMQSALETRRGSTQKPPAHQWIITNKRLILLLLAILTFFFYLYWSNYLSTKNEETYDRLVPADTVPLD